MTEDANPRASRGGSASERSGRKDRRATRLARHAVDTAGAEHADGAGARPCLCDRLSIPRVCPHSLRGLHATVAVQSGVTSRAVAGVLGHASDEITRLHYIAPGADTAGNARSLAALLAPAEPPKPASSPSLADLLNTIRTLSPEDRAILATTVGGQL